MLLGQTDTISGSALGWILIGIGLIPGIILLVWVWLSIQKTGDAVGVVVGHEESYDSENGGTTYRRVVRYPGPEGPVTFTDKLGTNPPKNQPGDQVEVRFDPRRPQRASIGGTGRAVGRVIGWVALGVGTAALMGAGFFFLLVKGGEQIG